MEGRTDRWTRQIRVEYNIKAEKCNSLFLHKTTTIRTDRTGGLPRLLELAHLMSPLKSNFRLVNLMNYELIHFYFSTLDFDKFMISSKIQTWQTTTTSSLYVYNVIIYNHNVTKIHHQLMELLQ